MVIGATVDGCPPGVELSEEDIQPWLDREGRVKQVYDSKKRIGSS